MKTMALLAVALAVSGSAWAADGYFEADVGNGHVQTDCSGSTDCSTRATGWKLLGGMKLTPSIALEGMYTDYGHARGTAKIDGKTYYNAENKVTAFGAGAAYNWAFAPDWLLTGRAGLAINRSKITAASTSSTYTQSKLFPYFGVGAGYQVGTSTTVVIGADFSRAYNSDTHPNLQLYTIGLRWGL